MKLPLSYLTLASAISLAAASSCTSDVAMAWPYTPQEDGSDDGPVGTNGSGGGSGTSCDGDVNCGAIDAGIAAEGQCNSLGLIDDSTCVKKLKMLKRSMKRTVNLDCASNEGCYAFLDDSLLCMDPETAEYHDDVGGSGNAISGVYTAPDGKTQTITGVSAEPSSTATLREDQDTASVSATRASANASQTETETAPARSSGDSSPSSNTASQSSSASAAVAAQQTGGAQHQANVLSALLAMAAMPAIVAVL